jgi:hypothetical protein
LLTDALPTACRTPAARPPHCTLWSRVSVLAQEDMFNSTTNSAGLCYEECNNRECLHNNGACSLRARRERCESEQDLIKALLTPTPAYFDEATLTTQGSVGDGAVAPVAVGLELGELSLIQDTLTGIVSVTSWPFHLTLRWQDSRLEASPCALVYSDLLVQSYTNVSTMMWLPSVYMTSRDEQNNATISNSPGTFELASNASWIAGDGPTNPFSGAPYTKCHKCATQTVSGYMSFTLSPGWNFYYYPFDAQNVSFVLHVSGGDMSTTCADLLTPMGLQTAGDARRMLPATNEWKLFSNSVNETLLVEPLDRVGKCRVTLRLRRDGLVFSIKQLAVNAMITLCGLCALFLHGKEYTGDRVALILISALICSASFQTDLRLGNLQYLIWYDCIVYLGLNVGRNAPLSRTRVRLATAQTGTSL